MQVRWLVMAGYGSMCEGRCGRLGIEFGVWGSWSGSGVLD